MRIRRTLATLACSVLASTGLVVNTTPASASSPCGSAYSLIDVYALKNSAGTRKGTLELYYSSSSRKNCVLTYGYGAWANTKNFKLAGIARYGQTFISDRGDYVYYAGPVYLYAPGSCISVVGYVDDATGAWGPVHCG
ncbi:hypothetical protein [Actinomadura coerulea]|uniref:hypothetical protein n=1 Tax=Actinomadura coerulea TaxID=46159 RepID=UPI00343AD9C9